MSQITPLIDIESPFSLSPSEPSSGFGEYDLKGQSFEQWQSAEKSHRLIILLLVGAGSAVLSCIFFIPASMLVLPAALILSIQITGFVLLALLAVKAILEYYAVIRCAPPTNDLGLNAQDHGCPAPGELSVGNYSGAVLENVASQAFKLKLIEEEKDSIVLCGCYCGGKGIFDSALATIYHKLKKNELNEVYIITSDFLLTESNKKWLDKIQTEFSSKFFYVIYPEINLAVNPNDSSWKFSIPHVKALITGRGKYAVVGGTGLTDSWAEKETSAPFFMPKSYHDFDHILFSEDPKGTGGTLYLEILKLFAKLQYSKDPTIYQKFKETQVVLPREPNTKDSFFENLEVCRVAACKVYPTGPEQQENLFLKEIIQLIHQTKKSIFIAHMYFHPSDELLEALQEASNRGVEITIISNGNASDSPATHSMYVELNRKKQTDLFEGKTKTNIQIFEHESPGTTFHAKVIVLDSKIVATGSANIGFKSLEGLADDELSLILESEELAKKTIQAVWKKTFGKLQYVPPAKAKSASFTTQVAATFQSCFACIL